MIPSLVSSEWTSTSSSRDPEAESDSGGAARPPSVPSIESPRMRPWNGSGENTMVPSITDCKSTYHISSQQYTYQIVRFFIFYRTSYSCCSRGIAARVQDSCTRMNFQAVERSLTSVGEDLAPVLRILVATKRKRCPFYLPYHCPVISTTSPNYITSVFTSVYSVIFTAISSVNGFLNCVGSIFIASFLSFVPWFSSLRKMPVMVHSPNLGYSAYIELALYEFSRNISYPQLLARLVQLFSTFTLGLSCTSTAQLYSKQTMTSTASTLNLFLESMNMQLPILMIKFSLTPATSCPTSTSRLHCGQNHALRAQQQLQRRKMMDNLRDMNARKTYSMMKGTNCTDQGMGWRAQIGHCGNYISPIGSHLFSDIFQLPFLYYYTTSSNNRIGLFHIQN